MPRQDSLTDQMADVMKAAVEMGCYDAHDWLLRNFKSPVHRPPGWPSPRGMREAAIERGCDCQLPWSSHGNYEHAADCPSVA